ncbi:MAG: tryptophan-rich sensory protein [Firmicutes bacterium]|nr:tryptophan-rich sensory protein [Bacillota bacterium]
MKLFINIFIPLATGGLSALLTKDSMQAFSSLNQPPLSPPGWLFPVVWSILYVLMGIAAYLVTKSKASQAQKNRALWVYSIQLIFNFFWTIIFFNLQQYLLAFFWLTALILLIILTIKSFGSINKKAAYLMIPYLLWCCFAAYLNFGIFLLNK